MDLQTSTEYYISEYTFFSVAHRTFSKIDHISKTEITFYILSGHNGIKLKISNKRNYRKYTNTWRLMDSLLNDQ
jgi:hypothetical protein